MPDKVTISFKDTPEERELYEFLKEQAKIIGISSYVKQIVYEKKIKNDKAIK